MKGCGNMLENKAKKARKCFTVLAISVLLCGCSSKGNTTDYVENKSEIMTTTITMAVSIPNDTKFSYVDEAKRTVENNKYTLCDLGFLKAEMPWAERRYPEGLSEYNSYSFNQRKETKDVDSIFLQIEVSPIKTLERYDDFFSEEYKNGTNSETVYDVQVLNSENLGEVHFFKFRNKRSQLYYTVYRYVFYDVDKNLIELDMQVPEDWDYDCEEIIEHIYHSIELPEGHYPKNDFLSNEENYNLFIKYRNEGKYKELYNILNQHISQDDVLENDSAYTAISILSSIIPYLDEVNIEYDDISQEGIIKYKSVNDISSSVHIVPIAHTTSKGIVALLGFEKQDWLFFNKITITGEKENWLNNVILNDKSTDIISGNTIRESIKSDITIDHILDIANNPNAIIRFENTKDDKSIDYQLSDDERNAMIIVSKFANIGNELAQLRLDYDKYGKTNQ